MPQRNDSESKSSDSFTMHMAMTTSQLFYRVENLSRSHYRSSDEKRQLYTKMDPDNEIIISTNFSNVKDIQSESITVTACDTITQQIHQSTYFNTAEKRAQVPFLDHEILGCDSNGREYTNTMHDITLKIPEGAIVVGKKIHFEIGVTMCGPFSHQDGFRPISPIIWLCILEEDVELKKPFQIILPHFLNEVSGEKIIDYHNAQFAKASHSEYSFIDNQLTYTFQHCDTKPQFKTIGLRSYAVLEIKHCCFYCIEAKQTPKLALDASYCLIRVESPMRGQRNEVYFTAIYFLETCLRVCVR